MPLFLFAPYYLIELEKVLVNQNLVLGDFLIQVALPLFALLFYTLFIDLIDFVVVNPMYSFLVDDFFKGKPIRLLGSLKNSVGKIILTSLSLLAIIIISIIVWLPFLIAFMFASAAGDYLLMGISGIIMVIESFLVTLIFYSVYPVITLENLGLFKSLKSIVGFSMNYKADVTKATGIMALFILLSMVFGFIIELLGTPEFLVSQIIVIVLFVFFRFILALVMTYNYVLNPVVYLEYEKKMVVK
ncbi:MAG: hypothetical protein ABID38_02385 [Candidatus Diapherotrites archaeon]